MQQTPLLHERVQMKSLRLSFERHFAVHIGRRLEFISAFVVFEILKAIPLKDSGTGKRWGILKGVAVDPQFSSIPHAPLHGTGQEGQ